MTITETIRTFVESNPAKAFEYSLYAVLIGAPVAYGVLRAVVARVFG